MKLLDLIPGEFVWRDNRFVAAVRVDGCLSHAHVANSGRLPGLLEPGKRVYLAEVDKPGRRTKYDLKLVENENILISVDARLPNTLFEEAVRGNQLDTFLYDDVQREVKFGRSRLDFKLSRAGEVCWIETKSVTLVENKIALFPDAPTGRGRKHLHELAKLQKKGVRSCVVFVVQRPDAEVFIPNWAIDTEFAELLGQVSETGVEVRAYLCKVNLDAISIDKEIPVKMKSQK
jgi:sugar fermentation stimulation protein A